MDFKAKELDLLRNYYKRDSFQQFDYLPSPPAMAAAPILRLILLIQMLVYASAKKQNITLGSTLSPPQNSKWVSPNGQFAFGFYHQTPTLYVLGVWFDNIPSKTLVWTVMKDKRDLPVEKKSTLQLTSNGLTLYDARKRLKWSAAPPEKNIAAAAMFDSGNFVLLNASFHTIWQSFDYPTDTLLPGQKLKWKSTMYSRASSTNFSSGRFELVLQEDADLVLFPVDRVGESQGAYWTNGQFLQEVDLIFDSTGLLYLVNTTNSTVSTLTPGDGQFLPRMLTLQSNGILVQYVWNSTNSSSSFWSSVWQPVSDPCKEVKGQCGPNGICQLNRQNEPECSCPPQFNLIDREDPFKGCMRSSSPWQSCSGSRSMSRLVNTEWRSGNDYSVVQQISETQCQESCRNDCFCVVVTYSNLLCRMKRMPLLNGRKRDDIATVTFVKGSDDVNTPSPFSSPPPDQRKERDQRKSLVGVGISLLACSSSFLVAAFLVCFCGSTREITEKPKVIMEGAKAFCYKEIETATSGFREELGRGAFGKVYKGSLRDGREIAVKALVDKSVQHGEREFRTEMRAIGRSHHKNLVTLYGFCDEGTHRLLVYEYMSRGSLDTALFVDSGFLNWRTRVQIAMGTARGLLYLHEECRTQILHCDIKPQNILLDQNYGPKISDFGLAKLLRAEQTQTITGARGTKGYIAPEWTSNNMPITSKVDVYSFGVMLLEIICCRKSMDWGAPENEMFLCEWIYECLKRGRLRDVVEKQRVEDEGMRIDFRQLERMVLVGLWCIQEEPTLRPSMRKVVQMMEGTVEIAVPPPPGSFVGLPCV